MMTVKTKERTFRLEFNTHGLYYVCDDGEIVHW